MLLKANYLVGHAEAVQTSKFIIKPSPQSSKKPGWIAEGWLVAWLTSKGFIAAL